MASRFQAEPLNNPIPLMPAAAPVDRFVKPAAQPDVQGQSTASQLAQALAQINPAISNFVEHRQDIIDQKQVDKARAMRLQTALNYKEAVKQGIITADQNPFFVKAWKEQDGRVAADQYRADQLISLATGPFASSTNHAETEPLLNTFRTNWMKENGVDTSDRNYMLGFTAQANAYDQQAREHQAQAIGNRIIEQTDENTYFEIRNALTDADTRGHDAAVTADGINVMLNRGILIGQDPKKVNKIALQAVQDKAVETGDMSVFDVLDHIKTGSGYLGQTREAQAIRIATTDKITRDQIERDNHQAAVDTRNREAASRTISANVYNQLQRSLDEGHPLDALDVSRQLQGLALVDPMRAHELREIVDDAHKQRPPQDDQTAHLELYDAEFNNRLSQGDINRAHLSHLITTETAKDLTDRITAKANRLEDKTLAAQHYAAEQSRVNKPKDIAVIPAFQLGEKAIRSVFGEELNTPMDPVKASNMNAAVYQFRKAAQEWRDKNPNAGESDYLQESSRLQKLVIDANQHNMLLPPEHPAVDGLKDLTTTETKPATPAPSTRYYSDDNAWHAAITDYLSKGPDSELGQRMSKMNLNTPDARNNFLQTQGALYQNVTPPTKK